MCMCLCVYPCVCFNMPAAESLYRSIFWHLSTVDVHIKILQSALVTVHKLCTQAQKCLHTVCVCNAPTDTKTYMPILKKTRSWGSEHDASTPIAHNQRCHTHVKYIKLLRNSTEIKKDKKLLEPSEADGVSQYQRTTVSVFLSLCLHLI